MAIDKLIPQYLNSDTDQKLVKSVEMTDNLNVRVSNDAEGTSGVIKNIKGNEVVAAKTSSDAFPSGNNRVIGSIANEKNKEILTLKFKICLMKTLKEAKLLVLQSYLLSNTIPMRTKNSSSSRQWLNHGKTTIPYKG